MLISWTHTRAIFDLRNFQCTAEQLRNENDGDNFSKINDQLLVVASETLDPWGNAYPMSNLSEDGVPGKIEMYSFGEDGVTRSEGNDTDDINTWDSRSASFYDRRVFWYWERQKFWQTLCTVPLLLGLAWIFKKIYYRARQITGR